MIERICMVLIIVIFFGCQRQIEQVPQEGISEQHSIDEYAKHVAKHHGFTLLLTDNFTSKKRTYCMAFISKKALTLQEGQKVIRHLVDDFLIMLQNSKSDHEITCADIAIKLTFFDDHVNRIKKPFLGQIFFIDDTIYYYQKDEETPELRLILKEKNVF